MYTRMYPWNTIRFLRSPEDGSGGGSEAPSGSSGDSGGGGGGAPDSVTPSSSPSDGDSGGDFDWSALGETNLDYRPTDISIPADTPVPPAAQAPVKPVAVPPAAAQPVAPAQQQPVAPAPASATQAGPDTQGDAQRPLTAAEPWRIAEALEANSEAIIGHLAQTKFALSEGDIAGLETDPAATVPRLLARAFLESQMSMQKFLAQAVPGMVKRYNTVTGANESAEKKFFDAHKALDMNNPTHRETTVRIATMYRQANPGLSLDQLIAEVGPMVMASLRIPAGAPTQAVPTNRRRASADMAFRPAVNGGGGVSPEAAPESPWMGLGRDYDT